MRAFLLLAVSALSVAACDSVDRTTAGSAPAFAATNVPDLDGLPDLTVDAKQLTTSWLIRHEVVSECAVTEGGVSPGDHRVLRFTATTPNVGTADVFIGNPLDHVAADDGLFEFAACHNHFHFRNYATYELISVATGAVVLAAKRGFCMIDVTRAEPHSGKRTYEFCGNRTVPGFQGISTGWADSYHRTLDGQYFVLDEPAAPVEPGEYVIRLTVNPGFVCGAGDEARPRDPGGRCHMFAENDYTNNVGEISVTIPSDTKNATGPGVSEGLTEEDLVAIRTKTQH